MATKKKDEKGVAQIGDNKKADEQVLDSKTVKTHFNAIKKAVEEKNAANAGVKSAYAAAKKAGIPKEELKFIIENKVPSKSDDFKDNVNELCLLLGRATIFAVAE